MRVFWIAAVAGLLLAGCQTMPNLQAKSDLTRDLRDNQVSFALKQDVTIPAARARLYLQGGRVVGGRNSFRPHCILEVDSVDHAGFPVAAETFDVVRIQRSTVRIALQAGRQRASSVMAVGSYRNGSDRFHDGYHFWLQSDRQPSVMRLTCYGVYERPSRLWPPTLEEIGVALGEVGLLKVQ
jgi:hypothetical protein